MSLLTNALLAIVISESAASGTAAAQLSRLRLSPERQTELALSTAPQEIGEHASMYILESKGYMKARTGTNGFSCLVEHQLLDTYEPVCYDAEGSATTLLARLYREELRASGLSEGQVTKAMDQAYKGGKLKAPRKPGFAYMLAPDQRVFDPFSKQIIQGPAHLMFYAPYATGKDFGGFIGLHAPFVLNEGQPDGFIIVVPSAMTGPSPPHKK